MSMVRIEILESVEKPEDLIDLLEHVTKQVREGFVSGYHPGWKIVDDTVEEEDAYKKGYDEGYDAGYNDGLAEHEE